MIFILNLPSIYSYIYMISFDEGPSKNTNKLIKEAVYLNIPIVFYLDPFNNLFNKEIVEEIVDNKYEVGMSITEEVNEDNVISIIEKYEKEFIKISGYKPTLLRLPSVGLINDKIINLSESKKYIIDIPNFDSEDDQKSDILPFLSQAINKEVRENVSFVFREKYEKSINLLQYVVDLMTYKGYKIVPASEFTCKDTSLIKFTEFTTTYEVLYKDNPTKIKVSTIRNNKLVKECIVNYSEYNKLYIRDLINDFIFDEKELEEMYKKIERGCKVIEEEKDVKSCQRNGCVNNVKEVVGLMSLLVF